MPGEARSDLDKELGDIRREVIEARNLVIKTDNLLKNLHAEVKAVGKRQEEFQKRQLISSATAYLLFAVLAAAGAVTTSTARSSAATKEKERLDRSVADLSAQLEKERQESNAGAAASREASEIYRQMKRLSGEERLKGVDALAKFDVGRLSPLEKEALADTANDLRKEIGQVAFERGKAAFRRGEMNEVIQNLSRFLAMNPSEDEALEASFFLGCAYHQTKKYEPAIPLLSRFVTEDKKSKSREYAMLLLVQAYEQTGQSEKAADTARDALAAYPTGEFSVQVKNRLAAIKRAQAPVADAGVAVPPGGVPAAKPEPASPGPAAGPQ